MAKNSFVAELTFNKMFSLFLGAPQYTEYWGGEVTKKNLPSFQKGGPDRISILEEGCWERGGDFFQGGCSFYLKNKLQPEIFNDKKVYEQKYFSLL